MSKITKLNTITEEVKMFETDEAKLKAYGKSKFYQFLITVLRYVTATISALASIPGISTLLKVGSGGV